VWLLANRAEADRRDARQSLASAQQAVELAPREGMCWRALGAVRYRGGDWSGAAEALEKAMALRQGGEGWDWLFLAMARWRQGQKEDARKWCRQAAAWAEKAEHNKPWAESNPEVVKDLRRLRAEAAKLLGLPGARSPAKEGAK